MFCDLPLTLNASAGIIFLNNNRIIVVTLCVLYISITVAMLTASWDFGPHGLMCGPVTCVSYTVHKFYNRCHGNAVA